MDEYPKQISSHGLSVTVNTPEEEATWRAEHHETPVDVPDEPEVSAEDAPKKPAHPAKKHTGAKKK